jgi:PAS domain S-box-containing protein
MIGMFAPEAIHPDALARFREFQAIASAGGEFHCETIDRRHDGTTFPIEVVGTSFTIDGHVHLMAVIRDITERKQAEEALRQSEQRWQLAVNSANDGIWDWNQATGGLYWSARCKEMLGYRDDELPVSLETVRELMHPDDRVRGWQRAQDHLEGRTPHYRDEYRMRHKDGSYRWILSRGMAIRDESGRPIRFTGSHTDITDRKRAEDELREAKEQAERASEAKSEFLATLSHELRTPLTPVLLTVSLMESHPQLPESLRGDVENIRRNVELESRLISDLLDLTRIARGKLLLDMQDIDLRLIVRSAIDICQREASARLSVDWSAKHHIVRGDSTRLQQVFWNLINNAAKFTGPDGAILVRSRDGDDDRVIIEVIDSGEGIDPAVLPRLFTAFEQGDIRTVRKQAGLGLGLAISKKLVESHGGTITAASEGRGKGATFSVALPTVPEPFPAQVSREDGPSRDHLHAPPLRILVVEDHEPTLTAMSKLLRRLGHRITGAVSLATATAAAQQERFDLIISDLGLPDGSGLDLMRQLKSMYAGRAIALTGYGMESDILASRDAGFADHLTKPVDARQLQRVIARLSERNPAP